MLTEIQKQQLEYVKKYPEADYDQVSCKSCRTYKLNTLPQDAFEFLTEDAVKEINEFINKHNGHRTFINLDVSNLLYGSELPPIPEPFDPDKSLIHIMNQEVFEKTKIQEKL